MNNHGGIIIDHSYHHLSDDIDRSNGVGFSQFSAWIPTTDIATTAADGDDADRNE
jgi:hypothetical protein